MTASVVKAWLDRREPSRPAALGVVMAQAVDTCPRTALAAATTMADALGTLGMHTLDGVNTGSNTGDALAMDLLAADAFVTYAFEAAAEEDVDVAMLARRLLREAA